MHSFSDATFLFLKLLYKSIIRLMSALICAASVSSSSCSLQDFLFIQLISVILMLMMILVGSTDDIVS